MLILLFYGVGVHNLAKPACIILARSRIFINFVKLQVQGPNLELTLLSHSINKNNKNKNKNPHLKFLKGIVLGD